MGHNKLSLWILVPSLLCIVMLHSKSASAQQIIEVDDTRDSPESVNSAQVWDARTRDDVLTLDGPMSAVFFPGGAKVLTSCADRIVRVWDARTGVPLVEIDKTGFNKCHASVSPDGSRILTTNHPYVKVWDAKTGAELLDLTRGVGLERHWPFPFLGVFSPDGKSLITCSSVLSHRSVFNLKIRDAKTGDELVTLKGHDYWPNCSAFSPDGSRVATGCETIDDSAKVWDSKTGAELLSLKGHGGSVWSVCFSPDGKQLATGGQNGKVRVWDARTGAEKLTLVGHERVVTAVSFSPDGTRILTGSQDHTARVWDAKTGAELLTLLGHTKIVTSAAFSSDGSHIVTASQDKTARIWDFRKFQDSAP